MRNWGEYKSNEDEDNVVKKGQILSVDEEWQPGGKRQKKKRKLSTWE